MRIALGSDHGGHALKEQLSLKLRAGSHQVVDVGTSSNEAVDYPLFARKVAEAVASGHCERGIMVDGAGIGSAMVANKVPGVRAALAYDLSTARNSREHNDANLLTLGAGLIGPDLAWQIVSLWLSTDCVEERHLRRVAMIENDSDLGCRAAIPAGSVGPATNPTEPAHLSAAGIPALAEEDLQRILAELAPMLGAETTAFPTDAARLLTLGAERLGAPGPGVDLPADLAACIDHTLLKPDARSSQIRELCAEAREHHFAAVCVNPIWVPLVASELAGSGVTTCAVVGFPLGASHPEIKAMEARRAIREGAREIDMVINIGALKEGNHEAVLRDIRAVVEACRDGSARLKVIIETCLLGDEEKRIACRLARRARAHFVKTSTGFAGGGATEADVALMAAEVREAGMEVKASGGIRDRSAALNMIAAGATRVGASASVAIVQEGRALPAKA